MGCYNVSVGPIRTPAGARMLRRVLGGMDFVAVRDTGSPRPVPRDRARASPRVPDRRRGDRRPRGRLDARETRFSRKAGLTPGEPVLGININRYLDTWASKSGPPWARRPSWGRTRGRSTRSGGNCASRWSSCAPSIADVEITQELMRRLEPDVRAVLIANRDHDHAETKRALGRLDLRAECGCTR